MSQEEEAGDATVAGVREEKVMQQGAAAGEVGMVDTSRQLWPLSVQRSRNFILYSQRANWELFATNIIA